MDAIETFVQLLDDQETDRALKLFSATIKSKNTKYKKSKLRLTLRGQDGKTKINRKNPNPFDFIISLFANNSYKDAEEKKLFMDLNYGVNNRFSNSEKFATAYLYFPAKTREVLSKIEDNLSNDLYPFTDVFQPSDKDVEEYIMSSLWFSTKDLQEDNFPTALEKNLRMYLGAEEMQDELKKAIDDVADWDLHKLFQSCKKSGPGDTLNNMYAYMTNHTIKDELKHYMLIELLGLLIHKWYVRADANSEAFKEHMESKGTMEELNGKIDELKSENEFLKSELQTSKKTIKNYEHNAKQLQNAMEKEKAQLIDDMKNKDIQNQDINKQLNNKLRELEHENQEIKANLEFSFAEYSSENKKSAVIHNFNELYFILTIYPEILFIQIDQVEDNLKKLDHIDTLYIVRHGVSSYKIQIIEQLCTKENKIMKFIRPVNERELIEEIAFIKKSGGSIQ